MKLFLTFLTALAVSGNVVHAQDAPQNPPPVQVPTVGDTSAAQKELDEALLLVHTTNLWEKTFGWKETGKTTEDVVAGIRKALGSEAPAIAIRGKDESLSTFVLQQATLGSVLCSLAELANRRAWVFPGRLVIASEEDLTGEERAAVKNKKAGQWRRTSKWDGNDHLEEVTMKVVELDLKQRWGAKGQTTPIPSPSTPAQPSSRDNFASYEIPFGELSAQSQKAIQDLASVHRYLPAPPPIPANVMVCLDAREEGINTWFLKEPSIEKSPFNSFRWYVITPRSTSSSH